jgi:hypothetical protein
VLSIVVLLAACGSGGGLVSTDAVSTTTTMSPAPEWLRRKVSEMSAAADGPRHGTGWVAELGSRFEAVETVSGDRVQNTANPPVYVVVVLGDFVSNRGFRDDTDFRGAQLTLVIAREGDRAMTDQGIGKKTPLPAGSERFSF